MTVRERINTWKESDEDEGWMGGERLKDMDGWRKNIRQHAQIDGCKRSRKPDLSWGIQARHATIAM